MARGLGLSALASVMFGFLYYYSSWLVPLSGNEIFGWRILLTWPCLTLFLLYNGDHSLIAQGFQMIRKNVWLLAPLAASSFLIGIQLWLFLWAPVNGKALEVSLGYFLMPLMMVLLGGALYHDRLSLLQKIATGLAALGVGNEIFRFGHLSWATLLVALGFPIYFLLRRKLKTNHLGGLWFDMLLMSPAALWFLISGPSDGAIWRDHLSLFALVPGLGMISTLALVCYVQASRYLSFSLFGLMGYLEPVLLVIAALLIGETIPSDKLLTYGAIWLALLMLVLEGGLYRARRKQRAAQVA
ncbi:EamA family transporter RarD [Affinibrenneria salicis]|uniref:EamA family transporter RarD n=1 Tax=Affinibrenneria salicis TaxID=2590031 RepID=A0A5J5G267_9GAMM|nr:EamA family transporter RarD [Affinibrenneria salicis]KAA8999967.1 EamA family transporter RarD [Affinibrenneria salicis]